jgi:uncharacterized protein YndB with AHSA1/START domain
MEKEPIVIERFFSAAPAKVWKALTDVLEMKRWYFDVSDFKPEPGFSFQFWGENEGRKFLHLCKVIEAIKERKISYSWSYEGYEGSSVVTFELSASGTGTKLKLTHTGLESFPRTNRDFDRKNFEAGWSCILDTSLSGFLKGLSREKADA